MGYDIRTDYRTPRPVLVLEDGSEIALPTRMEVCSVCDGRGTHVNPSIDSDGISAETFADDPDFADDYFSGRYDVRCYVCGGRNVEEVVDTDALTPERLAAWEAQLADEADYRAEIAAERRMGA